MRSKILAWRNTLSTISQSRRYAAKRVHCDAHMNELPVPCEPWQPWYDDRQSFYGKHLVLGFAWFAFSFIMMVYTGSFYLNFWPPAQPSAPSDSVDECDDSDT